MDPEEAVELARAFPPRVFITSLVQPRYDVDGIELTRRIKSDPRTRHTAVVITTTMIESSYHAAALAAGCAS
jgi:CheY-like chemotaxis protein